MSMKRVVVNGKTLNQRTADMVKFANDRLNFDLTIVQGSYNRGGVAASAGTHDGGGAVDFSVRGLSQHQIADALITLRRVGFAAWHRLPSQGPWGEHIHAIAIGDPELSSGAHNQVAQYAGGLNGLANHREDDGPRVHPIPTWPIPRSPISIGRLNYQYHAAKKRVVPAVKKVQHLLNYRMDAGLKEDGIFGPKTQAAYKKWEQHVKAPEADGVPGPFSLGKLIAGYYRIVK